jgi:hypothetical protein
MSGSRFVGRHGFSWGGSLRTTRYQGPEHRSRTGTLPVQHARVVFSCRPLPYTMCAHMHRPDLGEPVRSGRRAPDVRTSGRRHRRGRPGCRRMSRAAGRATCRAGVSRPVNARSAMTRTWPVPAAVRQRIVRELGDSMISRSSTSSSQCFEESSGVASTITSPRHRQAQCFDFGISEHRLPPLHRRPTTGYETGLVTAHERNPKADTNIS